MIKPVRAWQDSQGHFHQTREAACKAEYARLVADLFKDHDEIALEDIVQNMFELDRIFGEATKEDARVEFAPAAEAS
jgi:hypothetical protein